jgi:hypothetical protein
MRWLVATLLVLGTAATAAEETGIAWSPDLAAGAATAKRDNRPLLLYFTFET